MDVTSSEGRARATAEGKEEELITATIEAELGGQFPGRKVVLHVPTQKKEQNEHRVQGM